MKIIKNGNLAKLVAFFLIAILLTIAIAFSANGWREEDKIEPDSDNVEDNTMSNGNADENTDGPSGSEDIPAIVPKPIYNHYITGLQISEEKANQRPFAVVVDTASPLYGISTSYLTVELPTEKENSRFLMFTDDATTLGKLGSIAPTRDYITNLAHYFGATIVSYGNDDYFEYSNTVHKNEKIDFSFHLGYSYSEFDNKYIYTNADLVKAYIKNNNINNLLSGTTAIPYTLISPSKSTMGDIKSIYIPYSPNSSTELFYNEEDGKYYMKKNDTSVIDMINGKSASYDNVFVLYADSTTYETATSTQLILATNTGGTGYYISNGTKRTIKWSVNSDGNMFFLDENNNLLDVNCGSSYIGFAKSSRPEDVVFNKNSK